MNTKGKTKNELLYCLKKLSSVHETINYTAKYGLEKGLPPYELEYKEFTDKSDGLQYCYIEISVNGSYQGHTACIETKYKSVFNGLNINN
ncbi:hydrolase/hydrolase inhibitor [Bacteroides phage C3_41T2LP]|nr:hydrolase/hydrolase inhibitor [Bacteroides phage C3_41T2LP]